MRRTALVFVSMLGAMLTVGSAALFACSSSSSPSATSAGDASANDTGSSTTEPTDTGSSTSTAEPTDSGSSDTGSSDGGTGTDSAVTIPNIAVCTDSDAAAASFLSLTTSCEICFSNLAPSSACNGAALTACEANFACLTYVQCTQACPTDAGMIDCEATCQNNNGAGYNEYLATVLQQCLCVPSAPCNSACQ